MQQWGATRSVAFTMASRLSNQLLSAVIQAATLLIALVPDIKWMLSLNINSLTGFQLSPAERFPVVFHAKEWIDTLKLSLELRDIWAVAQKELAVAKARNLTVWGFTLVGE
ncbi:hypothetical protein BC937DRAFT_86237 [Endogone sp. FLAS-F59071]|nr:hypothetical protein BC937DRAFT_86237 [Endogone sp. FLAS-F59071]|eukprot:RUS20167.1 hypothetical protein BC937DRAFT_86237 [Endogone sp. FLAS-F59071]